MFPYSALVHTTVDLTVIFDLVYCIDDFGINRAPAW